MPVRLTPAARAEVRRLRRNLADFYQRRRLYEIYREINGATIARWEAELAALLGKGESTGDDQTVGNERLVFTNPIGNDQGESKEADGQ